MRMTRNAYERNTLVDGVHQPNQFGAAPFDFMAMAVGHLLKAFANRTALRRERERLFDFARDPFLAANQQHEPPTNIADRRDLPRERAGRHRRRAAALAH